MAPSKLKWTTGFTGPASPSPLPRQRRSQRTRPANCASSNSQASFRTQDIVLNREAGKRRDQHTTQVTVQNEHDRPPMIRQEAGQTKLVGQIAPLSIECERRGVKRRRRSNDTLVSELSQSEDVAALDETRLLQRLDWLQHEYERDIECARQSKQRVVDPEIRLRQLQQHHASDVMLYETPQAPTISRIAHFPTSLLEYERSRTQALGLLSPNNVSHE